MTQPKKAASASSMAMKTYFLLTVVFVLLACGPAIGQDKENTIRLHGTVYDPLGAVIVGAKISAEDASDMKIRKTLRTDDKGEYGIDLLPGVYTLTFESPGFKTTVFKSFRLVNAYTRRFQMDVALEVGACSDCDLVVREFPALKSESKVSTETTPKQPNKPKKP